MASLKSFSTIFFVFFVFLAVSCSSATLSKRDQGRTKPCKKFTFYFHNILYNGENAKNSTAAIIGTPAWGNKVELSGQYNEFGYLVAFDGPLTLDNNLHSNPIGRAQGFYLYNSKETFSAWFSVSFVFRSKQLNGSFNFAGSDPMLEKTRDISVVGGTGDFFMARGIATLMTDAMELPLYFRLRVDVKLFECW